MNCDLRFAIWFKLVALVLFSSFILYPPSLLAQGGLTPPSAPAPMMKTLQQIEPRIPIGAITTPPGTNSLFRITLPGSYYLMTNIAGASGKHGIVIESDNVTLDLRGFELAGVAGSLSAVYAIGEFTNLFIAHGTIHHWGNVGIFASDARNMILEDLIASENRGDAFRIGDGCRVRGCVMRNNAGAGISANRDSVISDCVAVNNSVGIYSLVNMTLIGCTSTANTNDGIQAVAGATVVDCTSSENGGCGISVGNGSVVRGCTVRNNKAEGILVSAFISLGRASILECIAEGNGKTGVSALYALQVERVLASINSNGIAVGPGSHVSSCLAFSNTVDGISVGVGGTVKDCTARANGDDGIEVSTDCLVEKNNCTANGASTANGSGIHVSVVGCRVEGNTVLVNKRGFWVEGGANFIVRNTARFNGTNYSIVAGNNVGPIIAAPVSPAISGNTGGVGVGTTDPWANFSY
jgi:hypothetical protein